jgi:trans-aconitate methyltransferase
MAHQAKWNAALYDEKHSFVWKQGSRLVELLAPKSGESVLDIGCGTGHLTAQIAASGAKVTGIDASAEMIERAREAYPAIRFEVADARQLEFTSEFDAVFSNATLHWITEPESAVRSISKALHRGGRLVAELGGKGNVAGLVQAVTRAWKNLKLPEPIPTPWYYPSIPQYSTLLEKHHLEVTYAVLFDRPTPLEDGERGLRNWLDLFGAPFTKDLFDDQATKLKQEVEAEARYVLFQSNHWVMDYRRLQVIAHRL